MKQIFMSPGFPTPCTLDVHAFHYCLPCQLGTLYSVGCMYTEGMCLPVQNYNPPGQFTNNQYTLGLKHRKAFALLTESLKYSPFTANLT